ncbi:protein FAM160A1-like [Sphaeramia orbicularis]|uniref:protein FAM160A1-like n=1 Tax=Sphaeramia orbicularis TaxID=375764 RepID=UPI00117F34F5|nr:protein FAM160A1-like [Sphaeramia orbicularis]
MEGEDGERRKEEGGEEKMNEHRGLHLLTNGFTVQNHTIDERLEEEPVFQKDTPDHTHTVTHYTPRPTPPLPALTNGHSDSESHDLNTDTPSHLPGITVTTDDGFLSQYQELMLSLGVEPDCDDITDDMGTFRRRVWALRRRLEEEDEGFTSTSTWDDGEEEEEEEVMEEEEAEVEEERRPRCGMKGSTRCGVPFTGPFISVLLSRLENLLENSIAVNLLVTGILAQLASYPQPLLRSFLLSTHTVEQPHIRTLYQVLVSVRGQIERCVSSRPDYPALLTQAWRFLLEKDQDSKIRVCLQFIPTLNHPNQPLTSEVIGIILLLENCLHVWISARHPGHRVLAAVLKHMCRQVKFLTPKWN